MLSIKRMLWTGSFALGCVLGCARPSRSHEARGTQKDVSPAGTVSDIVSASPLVVLRPVRNEIWMEGESYTIRWRAVGIARVNVGFALGGKDKGHAALDLPASIDSLRWRVPKGFVTGFGVQRSDHARVRVEDARDPKQFAESPSFTILAAER